MKKFGTPTAAAPGCASEKVGLLALGGVWVAGTGSALSSVVVAVSFLAGLSEVFFSGLVDFLTAPSLFGFSDVCPLVGCCCFLAAPAGSWLVDCLAGLGAADGALDEELVDFSVVLDCLGCDGDDVGAGVLWAGVVLGAGAGAGVGVGVTGCTTAPRSWTLTTAICTPATVIVAGALPGSPVHGTVIPVASFSM